MYVCTSMYIIIFKVYLISWSEKKTQNLKVQTWLKQKQDKELSSHFSGKGMGHSTGYFSEIGRFFKMAITQKLLVGISSNFLHSIRTSICIRKCNKNWG